MQARSEAALNQFIRGEEIPLKIMWQQYEADDNASDDVAENELQKGEVGGERQARDADDGECAGFGGNDGERNRPPGNIAVGEKVIAQGALPLAESQAEQSDPCEINNNDQQVERIQAHRSPERCESSSCAAEYPNRRRDVYVW